MSSLKMPPEGFFISLKIGVIWLTREIERSTEPEVFEGQLEKSMNMDMNILNEKDFYRSADLALVTVLSLSFPIEAIDRDPDTRKAYFLFRKESGLDEVVEAFWKRELKIEPQAFFNQLRIIKARLYGDK